MNQRQFAIITGLSLILMTITGGFSVGFAFPELYVVESLESTKNNLLDNQGLFNNMLVGILITIILDLIVSYTFYKYFERDDKRLSFISGMIRLIYTVIFAIATYFLTKNLNVEGLSNLVINSNFQRFQTIWQIGLVIFGGHVFLLGILAKIHRGIPMILWTITLFAGVAYTILSILHLTIPNSEMVNSVEMILALPMAIGEIGIAIWLLIKGGK